MPLPKNEPVISFKSQKRESKEEIPGSAASEPLIVADHLSFSYSNQRILSDVNFSVYPRECVGIIGPNGGGKTTLLKLIMGFLRPTSGQLLVFGCSSLVAASSFSRRLAYVPQILRFDKAFPITAFEVVLSGLLYDLSWHGRFSKRQREMAAHALTQVGMHAFQDAPFGTLSGGQAQRVLIARALVSSPDLLLLDEPTASIDPEAQAEIYQLLGQLKGQMAILMVTHDLRSALNQVDRLLCIQQHLIPLKWEEVCTHFALGLYHEPLKGAP